MHRSIQPGMTNHLSAGKSCLECRRRKIKCDKAIPCSYCAKVKVRCAYPPRKGGLRTGGQNLPDQELASRVQDIERTLISVEGRLSQTTQLVQTTRAQPRYQNSNELNPSVTSDVHELQARPASPYQVRHLDFATRDHLVPTPPSLRPLSTTIFFLWQTYLKRVHPVLKIIHAPSFQSQIVEYLQRGKPDDSQTHCLLYAVSYAAIVALTTEECEKELDYNRSTLLQSYRKSFETSFAQTTSQKPTGITVLQAFTLYTACGRFDGQGPDIKDLTKIAITMAIENGLNDENSISNVSPFEAEMRRRLWWQIFILDIRNAETGGSEPHIMESQMRTKFPSNVSDTDLDPDMSHIPKSHSGKSEMLFSLVRLEVSYFARLILFSDDFNKKNTYPIMSASEKCEAIDRFEERIELERVSHCDMSIPLDFVTAASCRLILAKLRLTVRKPQNRNSQQVLTQESFRQDCMEVLERAKTLRLHERGKLWRWLFQTYVEWDALTYLYISLSLSPSRHKGDVALAAAEDIYQYWKFKNESRGCSRWARIEELHTQALVAKELIQANPSSFGTSSNDTVRLENSESIAIGSDESASSAVTQTPIPGTMLPLALSVIQSVQQPGSSRDPERQFNQIDGGQNAQTAQEPLHIPSSGTACQWSTALFERYFEVLDLEQEGTIS